jgi:hypothetical protein
MQILRDIVAFVWAVLRQWVALMGGVIMTIITLIERERGNNISPRIYWPIIIGFVAVAVFLAWRKERHQWERVSVGAATITASTDDLISVFRGRTTAQGVQLAKAYKGKWMKVSGSIEDIREQSTMIPFCNAREIRLDTPSVILSFGLKWNKSISALNIGDTITVFGKVGYVYVNHMRLRQCELVEVGAKSEKTGS